MMEAILMTISLALLLALFLCAFLGFITIENGLNDMYEDRKDDE